MIKLWPLVVLMFSQCVWGQPISRSETVGIVHEALQRIASEQHLGVDPHVAESLIADMAVFAANFCVSASAEFDVKCDHIRNNQAISTKIIGDYLLDTIKAKDSVESVASRLAKSVGNSVTRVGWPENIPSTIGVFIVPRNLHNAHFRIRTATGLVDIGTQLNAILFFPGRYELVAEERNGRTRLGHLLITPRAKGFWTESKLADVKMFGRIDVPWSSYCVDSPSANSARALDPYNWARSVIRESPETRLAHRTPTAVQSSIEIKVVDESRLCDAACQSGLGIAFAQAIAVWRAGCQPCDRGALAVVKLGNNIWLDRRATQRILALSNQPDVKLNLDLSELLESEMQTFITVPSRTIPSSVMAGYEQVDQNVEVANFVCKQPVQFNKNWLRAAQGFLCNGFTRQDERLTPAVKITSGSTECGPATEAIACGKPGGEIQLTVQGYAYRIPTISGIFLLGSQEAPIVLDVGPVILHEVGHWFGVPHPESVEIQAPDIMQGTFDPDYTCVRPETLTLLSNAADDRWPFIAKSKQGLRPPSKTMASKRGATR